MMQAHERQEEAVTIGRLQAQYKLNKRQAAFVKAITSGQMSSERQAAEQAGYKSTAVITKAKKSKRVQEALQSEAQRLLAIREKADALVENLNKDAKGTLEKKLAEHAEDPNVTPNQTRAVELLGKMRGAFIERIEIDPGEFFRSNMGRRILPEDFSLE